MIDLTSTDRQLIAALKQDARASVTTLASRLNVSRATVQARMERLTNSGIIQRFTVELDASVDSDAIKAVMLIELEGPLARSVISHLK
ncbi:MAG: Lrp/AsnC family transcriptional regulator, partial [Pseudomonadota bacterium]